MYAIEAIVVTSFIRALVVVNLVLTVMNSALLMKVNWNPPPSYFSNILFLCHFLASGIELPGAVADFNYQVVKAVTLNFGQST